MRVIVTRPEPAASQTADRLRALGHEPCLLPLFRAEHLPDGARAALSEPVGGLILTSAEAARVLALPGMPIEPMLSIPVHVVGEATAEAARAVGFRDIRVSGGNGRMLAGQIAAGRAGTAPPLLYLAGEPRSPGLEEALRARDIPLRTVVCYRMLPVEPSASAIDSLCSLAGKAAVLLYSREAALRFARLAERHPELGAAAGMILCLSPAIADALPEHFGASTKAADEPREERLLALLPPT